MAERVSIKVAAERLDVSEVTVRRRIKKGELLATKDETPQGFVWLVELPDAIEDHHTPDQSASSPPDQSPTQVPDHDYAASDQVVTELRGQIVYLKDEIEDRKREHSRDRDDWRDELQRLHTLMGQQGQTLQALTQTVETLEALPSSQPQPPPHVAHLYASQAIPYAIAGLVTVTLLIWRSTQDVEWRSFGGFTQAVLPVIGAIVGFALAYRINLWGDRRARGEVTGLIGQDRVFMSLVLLSIVSVGLTVLVN